MIKFNTIKLLKWKLLLSSRRLYTFVLSNILSTNKHTRSCVSACAQIFKNEMGLWLLTQ
jgi:hypothetical protein